MELQLEQAKPPRTCSLWHHLTALWTPGETCHGQLGAGHPSALILGDTGCFGKPQAPQQRTRGRCVCSHLPEQQEEPRTRGVAKRRACSHQRAQHPLPRLGAQDGAGTQHPGWLSIPAEGQGAGTRCPGWLCPQRQPWKHLRHSPAMPQLAAPLSHSTGATHKIRSCHQ